MWHSLQFKIMLVVGIILLASITLLLFYTARIQEKQLLSQAILHTSRMSIMAERSIRQEMVEKRRQKILDMLGAFTQQEELEKIRLINKEGFVVLSTDSTELNSEIDMADEMCIQCHDGGRIKTLAPPIERGRIFPGPDGDRRLAIIEPIYNKQSCYSCHDMNQKVLGVLDAVFSLRGVDASIGRVRVAAVTAGIVAMILALTAVALVMQRFIRHPIKNLLQGTKRIAQGDLGYQITVCTKDELGRLCAAFNMMSLKLKKGADKNLRWSRELKERVRSATKQLEDANEDLRNADRRKSEFIRIVTHQLRAPVSAMQSFLRLITSGIVDELTPKQQEQLERVDKKCGLLLATVNDLLDMAAVSDDQAMNRLEPVDLCAITVQYVEQFTPLANKKGITLLFEPEAETAYVPAYSRDLEYLVANLLSNAVSYTKEGSVRVVIREESNEVVLAVSDTGIGIPEDDIPQLFKEFYRGENVTQLMYEGTGLGLSIVKRVVDKYGGEVNIVSTLGVGTTVTLSLPKEKA